MRPFLVSVRNVHEAFELLDILETGLFALLDPSRRFHSDRHTDYHLVRNGVGADFLNYDPFARRKVSREIAMNRVNATHVGPSGIPN